MSEKLKVVLIGAASPQWGFKIARDIIVKLSEESILDSFRPTLDLEDIDAPNLELQFLLAKKVAEATGNRVKIERTTDQKRAIGGARFIITSFAEGSLEAMQHDLEIPLEYGIYQAVGDTVSIGGAIRAARNIPAILSIARNIEAFGHADAWLLNLSNPMATLCRAVTRETSVRTIGCCHELYNGLKFLSRCLDFPYEAWKQMLDFRVLGVNHCGWMQRLSINGENGFENLRAFLKSKGIEGETRRLYDSPHPELSRDNVKINLFLRHRLLPYSGDRHTAEFFDEFIRPETNKGADFGVLLTTAQERLVAWRGEARTAIKDMLAGKKPIDLQVSEEAVSKILVALLTGEPFYDVGNLPFHSDNLPGVPDGSFLETMVSYEKDQAIPVEITPLPQFLHDHLVLHTSIIENVVEACLAKDRDLFIRALEPDPLLRNMLPSKISEMVFKLEKAHQQYHLFD